MKKTLAVLLLVTALAGMLTGCRTRKASVAPDPVTVAQAIEAASNTAGTVVQEVVDQGTVVQEAAVQEKVAAPAAVYQQWDYKSVVMRCSADVQSGDIICVDPQNDDNTFLASFLSGQGTQGWELAGVVDVDGVQSFLFKRAR
jgi:hypothetical protein